MPSPGCGGLRALYPCSVAAKGHTGTAARVQSQSLGLDADQLEDQSSAPACCASVGRILEHAWGSQDSRALGTLLKALPQIYLFTFMWESVSSRVKPNSEAFLVLGSKYNEQDSRFWFQNPADF